MYNAYIYQPDPMLIECLEMLSTCLAYWKGDADKEEMYEVKEKYDNLIACLQKEGE